jgi:hypothetical protein
MSEDDRVWAVRDLLTDYVESPSLRHIRDPQSLTKLAQRIVKRIDRGNSIWKKWDGQRELLLKSAVACWVPTEDLRDFLNGMPGPKLTKTDVAERMRAVEEEPYSEFPDDDLQAGCLALYQKEKAESTELPAIIRALRDHIDREKERLRGEREEHWRRAREEDRLARERRLLSGADCGWTQLKGSLYWYCRVNGRTYRASPTEDKRCKLDRVDSVSDDAKGAYIGKYQGRREATKALAQVAYQPDVRR